MNKLISESQLVECIVFHSGYYDGPLSGLCRFNGELCEFELHAEEYIGDEDEFERVRMFDIKPLGGFKKCRRIFGKWLFEICVGRHCSYPNRSRGEFFYWKYPRWFWEIVFNVYYKRWPFRKMP